MPSRFVTFDCNQEYGEKTTDFDYSQVYVTNQTDHVGYDPSFLNPEHVKKAMDDGLKKVLFGTNPILYSLARETCNPWRMSGDKVEVRIELADAFPGHPVSTWPDLAPGEVRVLPDGEVQGRSKTEYVVDHPMYLKLHNKAKNLVHKPRMLSTLVRRYIRDWVDPDGLAEFCDE